MASSSSVTPGLPLSAIFPNSGHFKFADEDTGLKRYRIDKSGWSEVEHDLPAQSRELEHAASADPFARSDPQGQPIVEIWGCKGNDRAGNITFDISQKTMDSIGSTWRIPPDLIDDARPQIGYVSMTDIVEYDLDRRDETSLNLDVYSPRFLNVVATDFANDESGYGMILRHDRITQVTACLFINAMESDFEDLIPKLRRKSPDVLGNPLAIIVIALRWLGISHHGSRASGTPKRGDIYLLQAKLGVTPDDYWLKDKINANKEDPQSLTAEIYGAFEEVTRAQSYTMSYLRFIRRLEQVNKQFYYDTHQIAPGGEKSFKVDNWHAYNEVHGRLENLIEELECDIILGKEKQSMLQSQFSVVYNMINQQDNQVSMTMAKSSKDIAQAMRKDGMYMRTIAVVTLVFLPATFVSAVFSTIIFDSQGSNKNLWWIYMLLCLMLTFTTVAVWFGYMTRWQKKETERNLLARDMDERSESFQRQSSEFQMSNFRSRSGITLRSSHIGGESFHENQAQP